MMNKRDWRVKPHTRWLSVLLILLYSYTDDVRVAIGGFSCARPNQSSHAYQFILDHGDVIKDKLDRGFLLIFIKKN
jgi:hypothetical protein